MKFDIIDCHGLEFDCWIGFHKQETLQTQKIKLDLQASVAAFSIHTQDHPEHIAFDYYEASKVLKSKLEAKKFLLIESLAHFVLQTLHTSFPKVLKLKVKVTKFPLDMPNCDSVSYTTEEAWI